MRVKTRIVYYLSGETAEMPDIYKDNCLDLC